MTDEETKKHLYEHDPDFRRLKEKHQKYKEELGKIKAHSFLTPEQEMEEKTIKKKKLKLKDQMQEMIKAYQCSQVET
jgi:uncharacterized protein YdcH (DUF465 family)